MKYLPKSYYPYATLVFLVVLFLGVNLKTPTEPQAPKLTSNNEVDQVTILVKDPITSIYPTPKQDPNDQSFNSNIFDGLVNLRSGNVESSLLKSWEAKDDLTWSLQLKPQLKFSNGQAVNLADVKTAIETALERNWPLDQPLQAIQKIDIKNNSLEIKTRTPVPNLILLLKSIPIMASSALKEGQSIGTGPYRIAENNTPKNGAIVDQTIVLERNPNYWGKMAKAKKIIYRYLSPEKIRDLGEDNFRNFDIIDAGLLTDSIAAKLATKDYAPVNISQPSFTALLINVKGSPTTNPLSQKKVRQALNLSIDVNPFLKDSKPAGQLSSNTSFGYNPNLSRAAVNRTQAKKLLSEAGYEKGFRLQLLVPDSASEQAQLIAMQLKEVLITTDINLTNAATATNRLRTGDFQAYWGSWTIDYLDTGSIFTTKLATNGSENYSGFSNPIVDEKIQTLTKTTDFRDREKILFELTEIANDELPLIPLLEKTRSVFVKDSLDFIPSTPFINGFDITGK